MNKRIITSLLLAICLTVSLIGSAFAADFETYRYDYTVSYTGTALSSRFVEADASSEFSKLLPGDTIVISATLRSTAATSLRWYMRNDLMEDFDATGGIYAYSVALNGTTIYGSEDKENHEYNSLEEATDVLDDERFLYLGSSTGAGDFGTVTLTITLDPETHVNAYFNDVSQIMMQFGVEVDESGKITHSSPKTGDEADMALYAGLSAAAAAVLAVAAVYVVYGKVRKEGRKS